MKQGIGIHPRIIEVGGKALIHPLAFKASEASECANEQQKFWPMHDRLFGNQQLLAPQNLPGHAAALGLNAPTFEQCLAASKYAAKIR